ncbi:MAG: hydrogenase nickel incorporation protein HypB [Chloroflexi bacterium]|nr:hydrogenase nickel incorporation protein HypB [Chloroflexota bacterium]
MSNETRVKVVEHILSANDEIAAQNRALLNQHGILAVNIMASPGAGKTCLILATIEALRGRARIGVIEGDIASRLDADRVAEAGVPAVQINTHGTCHLEAAMVQKAIQQLPLAELDLVFIENVGNLICPSEWDLGEHRRVVLASIPEGDDKPYKYPGIFIRADAVVISKVDLLPYLPFRLAEFRALVQGLNPTARIFQVSATTKEGIGDWADWLVGADLCVRPSA